ncbi:MAG TPA: DNA-binding domain-containing protein [Kofleriaceae bacterium]
MTLAELQDAFWSLATREAAGGEPGSGGGPDSRAPDPANIFVSAGELDAAARIEIYADMYEWRMVDALREDFPKVAALAGDERFYELAAAYLRAHPSTHPSLSRFGRAFPEFVAATGAALGDLARLEWARAEIFEEANVEPATTEDLAALASSDEFVVTTLRVIPALRLLRLAHDVIPVWQAIEDEEEDQPDARERETFIAVWRTDFDIFHVGVSPAEATALERAMGGANVGAICAAFEDQPDAIEAALRAVGSWFTEGWIAGPT